MLKMAPIPADAQARQEAVARYAVVVCDRETGEFVKPAECSDTEAIAAYYACRTAANLFVRDLGWTR